MGFLRKATAAGGVGLAVVAIAGCGSSGRLLSTGESQKLDAQLSDISQAVRNGDCTRAQRALGAFQSEIGQLSGVDATLVNNLNQGASTIEALTNTTCSGWQGATTTSKRKHRQPTGTGTGTTQNTASATQTTDSTTTATQPSITSTTGGTGLGGGTDQGTTPTTSTTSTTATTPTTSGATGSGGDGTNTTGGAGYGAGAGGSGAGAAGSGAGSVGGAGGAQGQQSGYVHGRGWHGGWSRARQASYGRGDGSGGS